MDPVGYKRVNKRTGKEIQSNNIVKGIQQVDGNYVILSDEEVKAAYPKSTQTIEIECFVQAQEIPFTLLETPYYLEPVGKSEKVYALLRESMAEAGVIGIARVVMHTKEHLAALVPSQAALILNTLRWASELRPQEDFKLPAEGKSAAGLKPAELKMAAQLIADMTAPWKPQHYTEHFGSAVRELVRQKRLAGQTRTVTPLESHWDMQATNVVDLTALLANSLARRKSGHSASKSVAKKARRSKKQDASKSSPRKRA